MPLSNYISTLKEGVQRLMWRVLHTIFELECKSCIQTPFLQQQQN